MRLARALLILLLLLSGAGLAFGLMAVAPSTRPAMLTLWLTLAAACVAAVPPIANRVAGLARRIASLTPSTRRRVTLAVWAFATLYLAGTAWFHARDLFPRLHDEQSYTLAAHMLARGRLWMPQHPLADFFESFHIFVRPVYTSIYFPGTALLNVSGIWLGLPSWVVPVLAAGLVVALTYRVTAELVDDRAGLLAALMVICVGRFRVLSTMAMSQVPAALLGLLLVWAWLHWRKDRRARWALLIGAFAGWAAITRPVDAAAFALPVGLAMLMDVMAARGLAKGNLTIQLGATGKRTRLPVEPVADSASHGQASTLAHGTHTMPFGHSARSAVALLIGAAPFLTLQLIFDLGVTGRPFKTPYVQYLEQNQPGSTFGSVPVGQTAPAPSKDPVGSALRTESNLSSAAGALTGGMLPDSAKPPMGAPAALKVPNVTADPAKTPPAALLPGSTLPQKQAYFYDLVQQEQAGRQLGLRHWLGERLAETCANTLPSVLFLTLLPVGLLGLSRIRSNGHPTPGRSGPGSPPPQDSEIASMRRWVLAAPIPLFFGLYLLNPFYLPHYPVPLIPPLAFLATLGLHVILTTFRDGKPDSNATTAPGWRNMATASLLAVFVVLCVRSLPELNPTISDEAYPLPTVTLAHGPLREAVNVPAVILFRYRPGLSSDDEPIYNSDGVWPDDAPIIHAHDLGERNAGLFRYYGDKQPARRFYLFDRGDNALYDLGTAQQALRPEALKGQLGPPIRKFGSDEQ